MWGALFPGQGSQCVGMGKFLFENFTSTRRLFEEASDLLSTDFKSLCFEGPESDLALTENTQPALLLVSHATYTALNEVAPLQVTAGAGHSVGEYAALVAAGALSFASGIRAVRLRGQFMQRAVPLGQGAMLAVIGLSDEQVRTLCAWTVENSGLSPIEPANFNAPGQVVVSGSLLAIEWLRNNFDVALFAPDKPKVRLIPLNVSAPFHCSMMKPAEQEMGTVLKDTPFAAPAWDIVQNITAQPTKEPDTLRENLIKQISGPVRWVECMTHINKMGVTRAIEFGAGKVLSGLAKKIDSGSVSTLNINSLEELKNIENLINGPTNDPINEKG